MDDKTRLALTLLNQNKVKKALLLIKKVNRQEAKKNFVSIEIEGICLFHSKKYQLSEIVLKNALMIAETTQQKCSALRNLKAVAFAQNDIIATCEYIKQHLIIDPSPENIEARLQLCKLSYANKHFEVVTDFAPKLLNSAEHYITGMFLLINSHFALSNYENALIYGKKAISEIGALTSEQVSELIDFLFKVKEFSLVKLVLKRGKDKFSYDTWYINSCEKITKSINEKNVLDEQQCLQNKPESRIVGENSSVVKVIEKFIERSECMGAYFHPELRIIESNGNLSIQAYSSTTKAEKLMSIPIKSMPILADYIFNLKNDKITYVNKPNMLNYGASKVMESLVTIYNETGKLEDWKNSYPLLALKDNPSILNLLLSTNKYSDKLNSFKRLYDDNLWDELTLKSFFGSREVSFDYATLDSNGIKSNNASEKGLLSVIDFLNHKTNASKYQVSDDKVCLEIIAMPDEKSKEVFVQYNISDPVITYLFYGFVDVNAPWVYSIPCTFNLLSGLKLCILNNPSSSTQLVTEENKYLAEYLPSNIDRSDHEIIISSIAIPNIEAKLTLPKVLEFILKAYDHEGNYQNRDILVSEINHIEKELLKNNLNFWKHFQNEVDNRIIDKNSTVKRDLSLLSSSCIAQATSYMQKSGLTLF